MIGIEVIPNASRLIKSLRDMGYDFSQAVADIIDNSINAGSSIVAIDVEFNGDNSFVRISDNGRGMKPDELREAMRYGSERAYDEDDLGKFGLGLKTASMSQCQCLSVATRWKKNKADITAFSWDLDHIEKTNRWEILPIKGKEIGPAIREPLKSSTGTVVLWQRLDRILGFKHPYGEAARKSLSQICRNLELHLGMVFHKFISGEVHGKKLKIWLNGNEIKQWDPYCRKEKKTQSLQKFTLIIENEGVKGEVLFEPYLLPHRDDFSSTDAFNSASGPASWNQQQGLYFYRGGRMIQSGGWSNLLAPDEHLKLVRIAVNISPKLDDAFKINVAKMRVQIPQQIREDVKDRVSSIRTKGREVYDHKQDKQIFNKPSDTSQINTPGKSKTKELNEDRDILLTYWQWSERVLSKATDKERPIIEAVLIRFKKDLGA